MPRLLLSTLCWFLLAFGAMAQGFSFPSGMKQPLPADEAFRMEVEPNDGGASLLWRIAPGYYLYRDHIQAETASGEKLALETPAGIVKDDPTFGTMEVFYDRAQAELRGGGEVTITYQGCQDDGICYPPVQETLTLAAAEMQLAPTTGIVQDLSARGGTAWVLAGFFGFGLLLSLTPCVFPMVPIVAGMLTRQGGRLSAQRGAVLSGSYVFAMALAFGAMGGVAGWSGQNLQIVLQSPLAVGAAALLFVALGLSSFGLFELSLPAALINRLGRTRGTGGSVGGALILGFTSALIIGPCVTAPLAGALLYITQTGDVVLGAAALFALGLGQGVPLVLVGIFGSRILPKAGPWMEAIRQFFGIAFLAMAVWLAARIFPGPGTLAMWAVLSIGTGVFFGALDRLPVTAGNAARLARTAGLFLLLWGGVMTVGAALGNGDPLQPLAGTAADTPAPQFATISDTAALRSTQGPALVYVTADWCVYCRGIDRNVLPDASVRAALDGAPIYKVDVTELDDTAQQMLDTLGAAGPPTMVFLNAEGREAEGSRLIGDVGVADVVRSARLLHGGA